MTTPLVSIVLATRNRSDVVGQTLARLPEGGLREGEFEVIVVDNASTDDTPRMLAGRPGVRVVRLRRNRGACAKALALPLVRAPFTLFLDDDSYPRPGTLPRMLAHFKRDPWLGAAGFTVHLSDGRQECSALPHVFVGCGVGLRTAALRQVGGPDLSFFMAAEEYDLAFKLLRAGWRCDTLPDLAVDHLKSPQARSTARLAYFDIRNNLRVAARFLPDAALAVYRRDWLDRYRWLGALGGHEAAYQRGAITGRVRACVERITHRRWRLGPRPFEAVFGWERVESHMRKLHAVGVRNIVLADLGKNIYAFYRGARAARLTPLAVADDRFVAVTNRYRTLPVVTTEAALRLPADAIVVSNMSYVHAAERRAALRSRTDLPVQSWFELAAAPIARNSLSTKG